MAPTPWSPLIRGLTGWIAVVAPVAGALAALRTHGALAVFGAQDRVAGIVAVQALRGMGPTVAILGAAFAFVFAARRTQGELPSRVVPLAYGLAVMVTPLCSAVASAAGLVTSVALGVETQTAWQAIATLVIPLDLFVGVVTAACYAIAGAALALLGLRFVLRARERFAVVLLAMLFATRLAIGLVAFIVEATLFEPPAIQGSL